MSDSTVRWTSTGAFPPHWAGTTITWTLTPDQEGRLVHFRHDGWAGDDWLFPSAALTWGRLMDSLKQYVETGTGTPLPGAQVTHTAHFLGRRIAAPLVAWQVRRNLRRTSVTCRSGSPEPLRQAAPPVGLAAAKKNGSERCGRRADAFVGDRKECCGRPLDGIPDQLRRRLRR
ncbi:MAG: SRPBCC family protein [Jiangellaceae bacterium]